MSRAAPLSSCEEDIVCCDCAFGLERAFFYSRREALPQGLKWRRLEALRLGRPRLLE